MNEEKRSKLHEEMMKIVDVTVDKIGGRVTHEGLEVLFEILLQGTNEVQAKRLTDDNKEPMTSAGLWYGILVFERIYRRMNRDIGKMTDEQALKVIREAKKMGDVLFKEMRDEASIIHPDLTDDEKEKVQSDFLRSQGYINFKEFFPMRHEEA